MDRDGIALVFDACPRDVLQLVAEFGRCAFENGYRGGCRVVVVVTAVRADQLEAVASGIPDPGQADAVPDVGQIAAAEYGDGALRREVLQSLGRAGDERGRIGIRDDFRQRAVEIQTHQRPSAPTMPISWPWSPGRWAAVTSFVAGAYDHIGEVSHHHVGAITQQARLLSRSGRPR